MGLNILITGGAGYIGSVLTAKLFQAKSRWFTLDKYKVGKSEDGNDIPYNIKGLEPAHTVEFDKITIYDNLMYKQVCFHPTTPIWTIDGNKQIKDIKSGDYIYSFNENTNIAEISQVEKCWISGIKETYKLKTNHRTLYLTDNHLVMIKNKNNEYVYKMAKDILKTDKLLLVPIVNGDNNKIFKTDSKNYYIKLNQNGKKHFELNKFSFFHFVKNILKFKYPSNFYTFVKGNRKIKYKYLELLKKEFKIDDNMFDVYSFKSKTKSVFDNNLTYTANIDYFRFLGFMLGDGWVHPNNNECGFSLGIHKHLNDFYISLVKKLFPNVNININDKQVKIFSKDVSNLLKQSGFISGFQNKEIPKWIYSLNYDSKFEFLTGLFDADGCWKCNMIGFANKKLMEQTKLLAEQLNLKVGNILEKKGKTTIENGKEITRQDAYWLYLKLEKHKNISFEKVLSFEKYETTEVWDLTVKNDFHNFLANGIVVHNCLTDYCYRKEFEFVHGDVRDWNNLKKYVDKADLIIPLAAIVGFPACDKDPELANAINNIQIRNIVDAKSKDQMLIFPNTNSGYGIGENDLYCTEETPLNPISVYGKTKVAAEQYVLDKNAGITLRLATVFGVSPRMRLDLLVNDFTYKAVNDGYIVLFEKNFKRNYIHIQDVAMTFIWMINNYSKYVGQPFNVGLSDANLSKLELCERIKKQVPKFSIQSDEFYKDPDQRNYIVSNAKLEKTGWKPYYSLDDGIEELVKAYQIISNYNKKFTNL